MKEYWTYDTCYDLAKKCRSISELKSASNWAYTKARQNGWLKDYTWFIIRERKRPNYWNNYEVCKQEAKKFQSITEFAKACPSAAYHSRKNNWLHEFFEYKCKPKGYWNNYDRCLDLALKCKTRSDFSKSSSSAYAISQKNGWLDSFDWLVDNRVYNDNRVDCVYVYEFSEFKTAYIGRTLMRRKVRRDYEHRNGRYIRNNGDVVKYNDTVLEFARHKNCEIPPMQILEDNLTLNEGRYKEDFWLKKYKDKGWTIINKSKTGARSGSIGSIARGKWNRNSCEQEARLYNTLSSFKKGSGAAYEAARINKWISDYSWFVDTSILLSNAGKKNLKKWTREKCYELAKTCSTASELQRKSSRAYAASRQYGWYKDYTWFEIKNLSMPRKWTQEKCLIAARTCFTKSEFKSKYPGAYAASKKNNWLKDYEWLVQRR